MENNSHHCFACESLLIEQNVAKGGVEWWRCSDCGSLTQIPRPTDVDLAGVYQDYVEYKRESLPGYLSSDTDEAYRFTKLQSMRDLGIETSFFAGLDILDVGCGTGQFLELLHSLDPGSLLGLDMSASCIEECRRKGFDAIQMNLLDIEGEFDLVCAFHVLEHLSHPKEALVHFQQILRPGGFVWIETPVVSSFASAFGDSWRYLYPNEHPSLFSARALKEMLTQNGFEVVGSVSFGSGLEPDRAMGNAKVIMDRVAKELNEGDTLNLMVRLV